MRAKFLGSILSLLSLLFLLLLTTAPGKAQMHGPPPKLDGGAASTSPPEVDENRERIENERLKKANSDRQAALRTDTEKLVKLAGELKDYVDKSNENVLSMDVVRKAEEIEKLAKSVREKMRGAN
ncbi:MAG: hypothetical protein ABR874_01225 [Candidatus Sulfotelmatobacter sp.]